MYQQHYGGIIWTDHALQRLKERGIAQKDAWLAFTKADHSRRAATKGGWVYYKTLNGWKLEVVAKQNEIKEWVVLTVWAKPEFWKKEHKKFKKQHWFIKLLRQIFFGDYR